VLENVCQMAVACAGGGGLVQVPAMLMEELIITES